MKFAMGLAALALVAAGANLAREPMQPEAEIPPQPQSRPHAFKLQVLGDQRQCAIAKGDERAAGLAGMRFGPGCVDLYPAMARASLWREAEDGTVTFASDSGEPLIVFAVADGIDYESIEPASPLMTLIASPD